MHRKYFVLSWWLFIQFITQVCYAQLIVKPIYHSSPTTTVKNSNARLFDVNAVTPVQLPFWDDFSNTTITPDSNLWVLGSGVFVNDGWALNPPTIGVATFDGIDAIGSPYYPDGTSIEDTDILTSLPIDLSGLKGTDNVFLSFYWQMKGLGDQPQINDNIRLEFYDNDSSNWNTIKTIKGNTIVIINNKDTVNTTERFTYELIPITDSKYFINNFQFRFVSQGGTTGPFDMWHIDYVYLNKNRTGTEAIEDQAIQSWSNSPFKTYRQLPYAQLLNLPSTELIDLRFKAKNFYHQDIAISIDYNLKNAQTDDTFYNFHEEGYILDNILTVIDSLVLSQTIPKINPSVIGNLDQTLDSISLKSEFIIHTGNEEIFSVNDQVSTTFLMKDILAFDDGSAELSAGLNKLEGQVALQFNLYTTDTLTHIDICFPVAGRIPSVTRFNLGIAKNLNEPTQFLRLSEFILDYSEYTINQFTSYEFSQPVILQDTFYIVLQTFTNDYVPIGLDKNTNSSSRVFLNLDGTWQREENGKLIPATYINGSLMIRAGFSNSDYVVTDIEQNHRNAINVFPNPSSQVLNIAGQFQKYVLLDLSGHVITNDNRHLLDTSMLPNGLYILKIQIDSQQTEYHKVLIRH